MKIPLNDNRKSSTISNCIVVFFGIIVYFLLDRSSEILQKISWFFSLLTPFFIGFFLAYFLNPLVTFFENRVLKFFDIGRERPKIRRGISIAICILFTLLIFVFLLFMFIPKLIASLVVIFNNFPDYAKQLVNYIQNLLAKYHIDSRYFQQIALTSDKLISMITNAISGILPAILSYSAKVVTLVADLIIGMVISIYFLLGKEHFLAQSKKLIYTLFPIKNANRVIEVTQLMHVTFLRFIMGKFLDSMIVGCLCFIVLILLKFPEALLIAVIIGAANIIPFFGPYMGAILSSILVLLTDPDRIIWFWLLIFILQQLDSNFIDPKISGKSTGLPAVWVILAILLGGGFFGLIGVVVSVPVIAVFYILFRSFAEKQLTNKGMPARTKDYYRKGKIEGSPVEKVDEISEDDDNIP
ncbi:MAG: AI-2E family transporter [Clostridiales bacterium]|nr:AI-2E family transporter [Clostridiales bacterium]